MEQERAEVPATQLHDDGKIGLDNVPLKRLRIAFATPEYVTEKLFDGGLANYLYRVARELAAMGHDIHVVTRSEIDQAEFKHEGVIVHRVMSGKAWQQVNRVARYRLTTTLYLLSLSSQVYRKLKQLNAQRPFHLLQVPDTACCGLFSILFLGVPHVLRASWYQPAWNDLSGVERSLDSRTLELLERLQLSLSRSIFVPCNSLQQVLSQKARLHRVRVIRTPIYLETEDWDHSVHDQLLQGKKYLLFFGRFELRKGFHILAQALRRFLEQYPNSYVVLVGRDMASALAPSMADYARSLVDGFAERLIVMDKVPHRQLYPVIAGAHLVVLPSLMDNLPNACLEAMALARPVIGTLGTSFDELITDRETGFLVPPDDADALAKTIIRAWTCPRLEEMGQAAKQKVKEFSPEKAIEPLLTYYYEILRGFEGDH